MATAAVLRPHDVLRDRFPRQTLISTKPNQIRNQNNTTRRKRSPSSRSDTYSDETSRRSTVVKSPSPNLVMGKVTILKRGEKLDLVEAPKKQEATSSSSSSVPKPEKKKVATSSSSPMLKPKKFTEKRSTDLVLFSGPDPNMVPKQIRLTTDPIKCGPNNSSPIKSSDTIKSGDDDDEVIVFAGSVIVSSPSPKSLPMPAFFNNSNGNKVSLPMSVFTGREAARDDATIGLCRLLHLDL